MREGQPSQGAGMEVSPLKIIPLIQETINIPPLHSL